MVGVYAALMVIAVVFAATAGHPTLAKHEEAQKIALMLAGLFAALAIFGMSFEGGMVWVGK